MHNGAKLSKLLILVTKLRLPYVSPMRTHWPLFLFLLSGLFMLTACASSSKLAIYPPYEEGAWEAVDVEALIEANPTEGDWSVQVIDLEKTEGSSTHLVRVRQREKTHYHAKHDLTAIMLSGSGMLYIGKDKRSMRPGDVVTIPRRIMHEFVNESDQASVFYVIFSPPYMADDRVRVRKMEDLLQ
jgi:quercetin dioxygenase-like cupin family protein